LSSGLSEIGWGAFSFYSQLATINLPESLKTIAGSAFFECRSLESVTLPDVLTTIDAYAFSYCLELKSITIPGSVTTIGEGVLGDCLAMTDVYVYHTTPLPITEYTFQAELQLQQTLHVQSGCKEVYGSAPYWNRFSTIIDDITSTGISHVKAPTSHEPSYNLHGQRVDKPTRKGLYIHNGRKVIIR